MSVRPSEKEMTQTLTKLKRMFPGDGAMEIGTGYQSLVAVLLSARTRDEQVLKLLPAFFRVFPNPKKLSRATTTQIEAKINTIGMYRQKAKNLQAMAMRVEEVYQGEIPHTMEDLTSLAGVGRKTASVLLPYLFKQPAIAVDTHVFRVTNRLGWAHAKTPAKTEEQLLKIIPKRLHPTVNRVFVKFGRYICIGKPRCWACPLVDICPYQAKNVERPKNADAILKDIQRREREVEVLRGKIAA